MAGVNKARKVMILDDNILDVISAEKSLKSEGYEVCVLLSAHGAFAKVDFEKPEILLLEIETKSLNTAIFLEAIRSTTQLEDMVVVLFSRLSAEFLEKWCIEHDIHGYYSKSMDIDNIASFLNKFYED